MARLRSEDTLHIFEQAITILSADGRGGRDLFQP